jgi:1-acyl-sn-glycerol-3-phosphate acyltransferase
MAGEERWMKARIRGAVLLFFGSVTILIIIFLGLPEMIFLGRGDLCIWIGRRFWGPSMLRLAGVTLEVTTAKLPPGPLIFAANHESTLDICVMFACVPRNIRFIAKQELFRLPIFGWYMSKGGHVPVDRSNRTRALESLRLAGRRVREGTSLIVFPEGTRSQDGLVHPFKKGPFVVAMEAGVPVVPVAISGAGRLNPKAAVSAVPGVVRVTFGEAVHPRDFADKTALLVEVRRRVIEAHRATGGLGGDPDRAVAAAGREGVAAEP